MNSVQRQVIAKTIVHFYTKKANFNKNETVKHFTAQGEKISTIYRIIKNYDINQTSDFRKRTGRNSKVSTEKSVKKVEKLSVKKGFSIRKIAQTLKISKTTVQRIKQKNGIKTNKCSTAPKYTKDQLKRAKTNCRKTYESSLNKILILDDESYVMCDPKNTPGPKYFNFIDKSSVPDAMRFKTKEKFPKRYLVWQAIDEKGNVSEPYVKYGFLKSEEYLVECLEKRLLPFIQRYHKIENILFWPDLASIHYEKRVQNWLKTTGINYVKKDVNPPNVPMARPIERFWSFCKYNYSQRSEEPKGLLGFKKVWQNISNNVALVHGQNLMKNVRKTLKLIGRKGVFAALKQ